MARASRLQPERKRVQSSASNWTRPVAAPAAAARSTLATSCVVRGALGRGPLTRALRVSRMYGNRSPLTPTSTIAQRSVWCRIPFSPSRTAMPPKKQEDEKDVEGSASGSSARIPTPPLVQLTSPWLTSLTSRIRSRPIPWEGYARADLVSQDELKMIRSVDVGKDDNGAADKVLDERGQEYAMLYLRLLTKLSRTDTLQQVLVLVGDMLQGRDDRLHLFFEAATKLQSGDAMLDKSGDEGRDHWPWAPLVR